MGLLFEFADNAASYQLPNNASLTDLSGFRSSKRVRSGDYTGGVCSTLSLSRSSDISARDRRVSDACSAVTIGKTMTTNRKRKCIWGTERGATLLEFAIVITVLLMMMFGIVDVARALYAYHFVANAAREASRYASVRGSTWSSSCGTSINTPGCWTDNTNVQTYVTNLATGIGLNNSQVTASLESATPPNGLTDCGPANTLTTTAIPRGCVADVEVDYGFSFILPFMPQSVCSSAPPSGFGIYGNICMKSTSEMVVSQ
jgi:hypothetical protein